MIYLLLNDHLKHSKLKLDLKYSKLNSSLLIVISIKQFIHLFLSDYLLLFEY